VVGAETGFKIESNPDTVLDPDVAFVRQERVLQMGQTERFWPGAPDLAVEVLSPSDTVYEVDEKVAAWLAAATPLIWVLNPKQRTIHVHRPGASVRVVLESDLLDGQEIIPGFHTSVSEIFADS
jgi:Uma2 family endonuclease